MSMKATVTNACENMSKIGQAHFDSAVDDLFGTVSDMLDDGEKWNKWCDIDLFFDVVSDMVGQEHYANTMSHVHRGGFPESFTLRGKANSPSLRRSIASRLRTLINCIIPVDSVPFPSSGGKKLRQEG